MIHTTAMSLSPVVIGPRCHYTNEFKELLTAEIILLGKEEEEANSLSNPFNKRVALENHRNALYQKFINIGGFFRFQSSPAAAPREIVLENIKNYWSNYKVQVRKEVPKYDGISFPDFERKDLENKSERKAIISSMPLLIPDVRCYQNEFQKIEAPAIKFIHKSMTTVDVFKHRHGGTSYVNGAIFSNAHPKTDARIFKAEDYPLDLNLKLLDGSRTFTQVKVRNADKRKQSSFNTMKAAAPILKKTKPNCRTSHYSSTKTNYMIAFGRKKQQIMNSNRDFRFQLGKEEHNITKLASEMEVLMEKDFKLTLEHMKEMESVSTDNPTCVGKYAKSMDISKDLGNEPHFDVNDAGPGISIWLMECPEKKHEDWYFLLPNCSVQGSKGVAIKLYHGTIIEWDGRKVKHCTAHPGTVIDNALFGLSMGPKRCNCDFKDKNGTNKQGELYIGVKEEVEVALRDIK